MVSRMVAFTFVSLWCAKRTESLGTLCIGAILLARINDCCMLLCFVGNKLTPDTILSLELHWKLFGKLTRLLSKFFQKLQNKNT